MGGAGRRGLGPDRVDQDTPLDRPSAGERQPRDQSLQAGTWNGQDGVTARRRKGAEQRDTKPRTPVHLPIFAHAPAGPHIRAAAVRPRVSAV
ncbi:hypothetical protein GCM10010211_82620 [Streptomyces albospinus]|uniref:Uncharacterized protein n=1 Tax=Streptomyces albospinus TaxID=285515 RepID=A0ABQ2VQW7_9ACTN|nr:hypothetical protein GCM10010211_82620 [Streptomyces albospinus]